MPRESIIILQGVFIMSVVITYQVARRRLLTRELRKAAEVEDLEDASSPYDIDAPIGKHR
jgi:hypothetical protein